MTAFAETYQLIAYAITLPFAVGFVLRFARPSERWWRSMFGVSLMTLAIAVVLVCVQTILFRLFGPDYPGRWCILIVTATLTLVAMILRYRVLGKAQREDRAHPPTPTQHL